MQNIKDMLFFINIFDMVLATVAFAVVKLVLKALEKAVLTRSLEQYTRLRKFNEGFGFFTYLRITFMFISVYAMLNMLDLAEGTTEGMIDTIGAIVSAVIVAALFIYIIYQFTMIRKFGEAERSTMPICSGLKTDDRYSSSAWMLYLAKMFLISALLIFMQPLTRVQALSITTCNIALLLYICLKQPFSELSLLLVAIIDQIGITFLSIFFSFFTSMGITVRVKLKMAWIIMITMFILVFLNVAFIINEIIKSIIAKNKKKFDASNEPDVRGTEGDEQLKNGKLSPHGDDDLYGKPASAAL